MMIMMMGMIRTTIRLIERLHARASPVVRCAVRPRASNLRLAKDARRRTRLSESGSDVGRITHFANEDNVHFLSKRVGEKGDDEELVRKISREKLSIL